MTIPTTTWMTDRARRSRIPALLAGAMFVVWGCSCAAEEDFVRPVSEHELVQQAQYALLHEGAMPIDEAMVAVGTMDRAANPMIAPQPSEAEAASVRWAFAGALPGAPTEATMPIECAAKANPEACWGQKIHVAKGCNACHGLDGVQTQPGPNWKGLFGSERVLTSGETVVAGDDYIRASITDPWSQLVQGYGKVMPPQGLQEPEVEAVLAFIKTLGGS